MQRLTTRGAHALAWGLFLGAVGCASDPTVEAPPTPTDCVSTEDFFRTDVWAPILSPNCIQCHNPQGSAKIVLFSISIDWPGAKATSNF